MATKTMPTRGNAQAKAPGAGPPNQTLVFSSCVVESLDLIGFSGYTAPIYRISFENMTYGYRSTPFFLPTGPFWMLLL